MSEATDKVDRFGHCVHCGENLLTKKVVDGQVIDMFLPTYDHTFFLLNTGSQMQVTICKSCKNSLDLNDPKAHKQIMDCVYKGWELEEKKNPGYYERELSSNLSIDCHSEYLDKNVIKERQAILSGFSKEGIEVKNVFN